MSKYFIEHLKKQIYICFDGKDNFHNLRFKQNDCEYLFVEFVPKNNRLADAFKRVLKLKDKNNALHSLFCMIIKQFNIDPKKDEKGEYKYIILPESDKDLKLKNKDYPSVHIFTGEKYYDHTYLGNMII